MFKVGEKVISKELISCGPQEVIEKFEELIILKNFRDDYLSFKNKIYYYKNSPGRFVSLKEYRREKLQKICLSQEIE
jgi:hypothetical protein